MQLSWYIVVVQLVECPAGLSVVSPLAPPPFPVSMLGIHEPPIHLVYY